MEQYTYGHKNIFHMVHYIKIGLASHETSAICVCMQNDIKHTLTVYDEAMRERVIIYKT